MNPLWILPLAVLIAVIYLAGRHAHDDDTCDTRGRIACTIVRAAAAFRAFNADNIEIYERYLRAQRPSENERLHWVRSSNGWHLEGTAVPPSAEHNERCN